MKTHLLTLSIFLVAAFSLQAGGPPPAVWDAYRKEFPNTGQIDVVAQATVQGSTFWALYGADRGEGGEPGADTEATFQVLPNGTIRRINGTRWVRPFSTYIRDPEVINALLKDALNREEAQFGGRGQLQRAIMGRQQMSLESALYYKRNGYNLPQGLMVSDNTGRMSPAASNPELR